MKKITNIVLLFIAACCFLAIMSVTWNWIEILLSLIGVSILWLLMILKR